MSVSLCVITLDEEDCILNCFNSVKHLIDEIVLVDTGSKDGTVDLARGAGAKIYQHQWEGDFSRARNYGLERCSSDWVLVLDADEVLLPTVSEQFNSLFNKSGVEGYFLNIHNYLGDGSDYTKDQVVRLFKNKPQYKFEGAIHEQVAPSIISTKGISYLASCHLTVAHYGYLSHRLDKKQKTLRNTDIINRELIREPNNPFLLFSLAIEQYQCHRIKEGLDSLKLALARMTGKEGYFQDVLINIALGLLRLGRLHELSSFLKQAMSMLPGHPELTALKGLAEISKGDYHTAAVDLEHSLESGAIIWSEFKTSSLIGDAYNLAGEIEKAASHYINAFNANNLDIYSLKQLLGLIRKHPDKFADRLCRIKVTDPEGWLRIWEPGKDNRLRLVMLLLAILSLDKIKLGQGCLSHITGALYESLRKLALANPLLETLVPVSGEIDTLVLMVERNYDFGYFSAVTRLNKRLEKLLTLVICTDGVLS